MSNNSVKQEYKHKPDKGVLFVNEHKTKDSQPDYVGNYTTSEGVKRNIAAWHNKTKNREYLSISFSDTYNAGT